MRNEKILGARPKKALLDEREKPLLVLAMYLPQQEKQRKNCDEEIEMVSCK